MAENNQNHNHRNEHWMSYLLPVALIAGLVALLTIIAGQPTGELQPIIPQETWLTQVVGYLIIATEAAAAYVIGAGVIRAIISYTRHLFDKSKKQINSTEEIRLRLGHMLTLGLEFAMGSDILRLAVSPTTADVIILFAIVLLRILLNYFLEREIRTSAEYIPAAKLEKDI
jgi:uncharacterized membrane protein